MVTMQTSLASKVINKCNVQIRTPPNQLNTLACVKIRVGSFGVQWYPRKKRIGLIGSQCFHTVRVSQNCSMHHSDAGGCRAGGRDPLPTLTTFLPNF